MKNFKSYSCIDKELLDDIKKHDLEYFEIVGEEFGNWKDVKVNEVMKLKRIVKTKTRPILYFQREGHDVEIGINDANLKLFGRRLVAWI